MALQTVLAWLAPYYMQLGWSSTESGLLLAAIAPHGLSLFRGDVRMASLDHAMWFHRDFRIDDWLLYALDSPSAQQSRGLTRGQYFDRQGRLVASTAQEGLIRVGTAHSGN